MITNNDPEKYLNTNDMINDYAFMYQIMICDKPLDFEAEIRDLK